MNKVVTINLNGNMPVEMAVYQAAPR